MSETDQSGAAAALQAYAQALHSDAGCDAAAVERLVLPRHAGDHQFYLGITEMLAPAFPAASARHVRDLTLAFYGIFRMVLAFDRIADRGECQHLPDVLTHYTVTLRRLSRVFGSGGTASTSDVGVGIGVAVGADRSGSGGGRNSDADSRSKSSSNSETDSDSNRDSHANSDRSLAAPDVWRGLSARIAHSAAQIAAERTLRLTDTAPDAFIAVAAGKSALIQAPVDWLDALDPHPAAAAALRGSLLRLHLGMQWLDDVIDLPKDVESGQVTWTRARLQAYAAARGIDLSSVSGARQQRVLFASGLAHELLDAARTYVMEGMREAVALDVPAYLRALSDYEQRIDAAAEAVQAEVTAAGARLAQRRDAAIREDAGRAAVR